MLSAEEISRINRYSVELERQRFSDEQLWSRLIELNDREIRILRVLPLAFRLAFSFNDDYKEWRQTWNELVAELSANQPVIDCIIWHLQQRGDEDIANWIVETEDYKRRNAMEWEFVAHWSVH